MDLAIVVLITIWVIIWLLVRVLTGPIWKDRRLIGEMVDHPAGKLMPGMPVDATMK